MQENIIIEPRFCGPENSGNGGYVCGLLANCVDYTAEVTLYKPPPLSTEMKIITKNGHLQLMHFDALIAKLKPGVIDFDAPQPPDFKGAQKASMNYVGFKNHPYPTCFVCGPHRVSPDALCIYPGKVGEGNTIAAPWVPDEIYADDQGNVNNEYIWSALDCPGGIVVLEESKKILLGRMTAEIRHKIRFGERCVVIGWLKAKEGRKFYSGSALFSESNGLCAVANAIWIDAK